MKREPLTTVLCYGDSNTYGYDPQDGLRYTADVRWPGRLQRLLDPTFHVIEEGCNGRTASVRPEDEPWKDGRSCLKAILNSHKPVDVFVLMLGTNDLKKQFTATPESIAAGVRDILNTAAEFLEEKQGFRPRGLLIAPAEIAEGIVASPFAHSFDGKSRQWNKSSLSAYIAAKGDTSGELSEREELTFAMRHNEALLKRLRTSEGLSLTYFSDTFGSALTERLMELVQGYIERGTLVYDDSKQTIRLSRSGLFISDAIISDLFLEED